jgi:hypothetical protein
VGEKYKKFDNQITLRKRLKLNLTGGTKLGENLTEEQKRQL